VLCTTIKDAYNTIDKKKEINSTSGIMLSEGEI
jgi:hypothetical protein